MLWKKFESDTVASNLAFIGSIRDDILDVEALATHPVSYTHLDVYKRQQVFRDLGLDPAFYANRVIATDEVTPWSHMDYGVTHDYLVREYEKALAAKTTQPCNRACAGCGANKLLGGPCFDYH